MVAFLASDEKVTERIRMGVVPAQWAASYESQAMLGSFGVQY